jgi:anti-sigma regulatory factor (Ser/Thr protein kinase)
MFMTEALVEVVRLALPCDAGAPGVVRDELERIKEIEPVRTEAKLVASELVSNAIRHSGCEPSHEIDVRVRLGRGLFEIAVRDPGLSDQLPEVQENAEVGGFGLSIVNEIAHRWGMARSDGQVVWAQLSLPPTP